MFFWSIYMCDFFRKIIFSFLLFSISSFSFADSCILKNKLEKEQWNVIKEAYQIGYEYDLGYTLASISVIESNAGLYVENDATESYGVPQIRVTTAIKRLGLEDSNRNREGVKNRLIKDNEFAFDLAIEELKYWLGVRQNWRAAIQSYNAGWIQENGKNYMFKVVNTLNELEKCENYLT